MSADAAAVTSGEHAGFTLSGTGAAEAIATLEAKESSKPEKAEGDEPKAGTKAAASKAASELGKRGGAAAAKARAAKPAEKPSGPSVELDEMALADAKKRAAKAGPDPEPAVDEDEGEEEDATGDPRLKAQARIAELARERRELRDQLKAERAEREQERRERARPAEDKPKVQERREAKPDAKAKPVLEDFLKQHDDYNTGLEAYIEARDQHRDAERAERQQREQRAHAYARGVQTAVGAFNQRLSEAAKTDPALIKTANAFAQDIRPSFSREEGEKLTGGHVIADVIIQSEHAPALLRHFAADGGVDGPDFQRIAALRTPAEIRLAMAKLEGRLEQGLHAVTADTSGRPEKSKAPPPVRSVTGAPNTATGAAYREGETFDEWNARQGRKATTR